MAYELFCQSVQGAGHIKKGMPCEDYGIKFENNECKIFVLGDGHGDSNCPRSSLGSKWVCEIAVDELRKFAKDVKEQNWEQRLFCNKQAEKMIFRLVSSIFGKWALGVKEDYHSTPLTEDEEKAAAACLQYYRRGERIEHIYGTTFIAGLMSSNYLLLLQQGDGRCVVFDADGNASQPIPWDDRCIANVTTSVCDLDAVVSCRYHIIDLTKNQIAACFIGSDGVEDSFGSMDMMHKYYREELLLASTVEINEYERHLLETLPRISEYGSGDDITICGVLNPEAINKLTQKFIDENEKTKILYLINKARERLRTMEPKLVFLQKKGADAQVVCSQLERKWQKLEDEYQNTQTNIDTYLRELERIKEEKDVLSLEMQNAFSKKKICDDEYTAYKQTYDEFVCIKEENEAKYKTIGTKNIVSVESQSKVPSGGDSMVDDEDTSKNETNTDAKNKEDATDSNVPAEKFEKSISLDPAESIPVQENEQSVLKTEEAMDTSVKKDVPVAGESSENGEVVAIAESNDSNEEIGSTNTEKQEKKTKSGFLNFFKAKPQS